MKTPDTRRRGLLRVAVLCSQRAPGLLHLLNFDRNRGRLFDVVCVVTSEATYEEEVRVERRGVTSWPDPIRAFHERRGARLRGNLAVRADFDRQTLELLEPHRPDLVLLDGYLYLVSRTLLDGYPGRILNLHFSDLTLRLPDGRPRFPGVRAVRDALLAGQPATCATVHLVNEVPDGGAPIVRSWNYPASPLVAHALERNDVDLVRAYADAHQRWMLQSASGPLLSAALDLIGSGNVDLDALSTADPSTVAPWLLAEDRRLIPPCHDEPHATDAQPSEEPLLIGA